MNNNLFFVPFAFDEAKATGANIKNRVKAPDIYLKGLCVSLISAKRATPDMDVALVSNMNIPAQYETLLSKNGVLIFIEPFDAFVFEDTYRWCLAFYKLCALEKMVAKYDYDHYFYTDADVFVQKSLDGIIPELKDNILLYDTNYGLYVKDYLHLAGEFKDFGITSYITHYGGEFFAASHENAEKFIAECKAVYEEIRSKNFVTESGDEFIISIAAYRMKPVIKNAGAYIFRFWTGDFYLVSTCYRYHEVAVLHLPGEKNGALLRLYRYFCSKNRFPQKRKVHRICHLTRKPIQSKLKGLAKIILGRERAQ